MPIFEYDCQKCNENFEKLVRNSMKQVICPNCSSDEVEKRLSKFAVSGVSAPSGSSGGCNSCSSHNCGSCH